MINNTLNSWAVFLTAMGCLYVFLRGMVESYGFDRVFRVVAIGMVFSTFAFAITTPSTVLGTYPQPQRDRYEQADAYQQKQIDSNTKAIAEIQKDRETWRASVEARMAVLENNTKLLQGVFDRMFWLWMTVGAQFLMQCIAYFWFKKRTG